MKRRGRGRWGDEGEDDVKEGHGGFQDMAGRIMGKWSAVGKMTRITFSEA